MPLKNNTFSSLSAVQLRALISTTRQLRHDTCKCIIHTWWQIVLLRHFFFWSELSCSHFKIKWHHTFLLHILYKALSEIRVPFVNLPLQFMLYLGCTMPSLVSIAHCNHFIKWYLKVTCLILYQLTCEG